MAFVEAPMQEEVPVQEEVPDEPVERPPRTAVLLATAHRMLEMIDRGEIDGHTGLARMLGVSRARVAQILDLTLLAPEIQERIFGLAPPADAKRFSQSSLPRCVRQTRWAEQRAIYYGTSTIGDPAT